MASLLQPGLAGISGCGKYTWFRSKYLVPVKISGFSFITQYFWLRPVCLVVPRVGVGCRVSNGQTKWKKDINTDHRVPQPHQYTITLKFRNFEYFTVTCTFQSRSDVTHPPPNAKCRHHRMRSITQLMYLGGHTRQRAGARIPKGTTVGGAKWRQRSDRRDGSGREMLGSNMMPSSTTVWASQTFLPREHP